MGTMKAFLEANSIKAEVTYGGEVPEWAEGMNPWKVVLKMGHRQLTVPFLTGPALTKEPTAADVLDCLASDASGYENTNGFEDWAADYGYGTDSRKAEKTFKAVARLSEKLRRFLGPDLFKDLLWNTERL